MLFRSDSPQALQEPVRRTFTDGMEQQLDPSDHSVPHLIFQLQDDLARSRQREAFWMSVTTHAVAIILLLTSPKWMPSPRAIVLTTPAELLRDRQLTYLSMPKDAQPPVATPKTNIISDKNRIAQSRSPVLDPKELQRLISPTRPGAPGAPGTPSPQPPSPQQQVAQSAQGEQPQAPKPPQPTNNTAQLQTPIPPVRSGNLFAMKSATSQLQEAVQGAAMARGGGGAAGDYGSIPRSNGKIASGTEILSDTMGVDFSRYLERLRIVVQGHWYDVMPLRAMQPPYAKGHVAIQFMIMRDGSIKEAQMVLSSGDRPLDEAAGSAITSSHPLPPLPKEFGGEYILLRCHFFYNPDKNDLQ